MLAQFKYLVRLIRGFFGRFPRTCPGCGYTGRFRVIGIPPRYDARCPRCQSLERHRLLFLAAQENHLIKPGAHVLHVAPEKLVQNFLKPRCERYTTLDLYRKDVDIRAPLERTTLPDASLDHVVCLHVLEHVDDAAALDEIFRILRPGGTLLAMVPLIEGWDTTYENPAIVTEEDRELHFGQGDHVRYYGRDFRDRLRRPGFRVSEFTAQGADVIRYGLLRGEKLFVAAKP